MAASVVTLIIYSVLFPILLYSFFNRRKNLMYRPDMLQRLGMYYEAFYFRARFYAVSYFIIAFVLAVTVVIGYTDVQSRLIVQVFNIFIYTFLNSFFFKLRIIN